MRRIQRSNASTTASSSAKTSGWSHSADVRIAIAGRYGSKLPAYSSASTTNGASGRPRCAVDGSRRSALAQQRADERGRVEAALREDVDEPARRSCSCRASRRRRRGAGPPPRPRRPAATARAGCRAAGPPPARGGPGRSRSGPSSPRAGPGGEPGPVTWAGSCSQAIGMPVVGEGRRVRRRAARVAAAHVGARPAARGAPRRSLPRPAMPEDVDPLAGAGSGRGVAGRREAGADGRGARSPARARARGRRRPARAAARGPRPRSTTLFAARSPDQR